MSEWKGFTAESKRYMGYPTLINTSGAVCWARLRDMNREELRRAVRFWFRFPAAYCRFSWYSMRDKVRQCTWRLRGR